MSTIKPQKWKFWLAAFGTVIWFILLQSLQSLNNSNYFSIRDIASGYSLGFITAFSAFVFWDIVNGGFKRYIDKERGIFRITAYFTLVVLFSLGLLGFINGIFNSMPWQYFSSFAIACIIVNQCLIPVINYADKNNINGS
ncbi:hypothetical protein [Pectobacterium aroidearum]|uniref:hypothetical protein n=1 Tax=Pectobacterium aroidearum TaxID=1201031 RepID=UPI0030161E5B